VAVLSAILLTALLTALGVAIALLGIEESMLASHARTARALRLASSAAAQLAVADLRALPSWNGVIAAGAAPQLSAVASRFADATLTPLAPWDGSTIDLGAVTDRWQSVSDASRGAADAPQVWRLFAYGPLEQAAPGTLAGPWYVAVWIADDRADIDGDPCVDSNGILSLRAVAMGPSEAVASTDVSVQRTSSSGGPDRVRILTVRPGS